MGRHVIESAVGRDRMTRIPIRRFVEPSEVTAAVIFLLSDAAAGFAGQTLHVNGGELMRLVALGSRFPPSRCPTTHAWPNAMTAG